jgi:hypothetical protein
MRRRASVLIAVGLVGLIAALTLAGQASGGGRPLSATLSGASENPPTGSSATGQTAVRLNHGQGTVCYDMSVSGLSSNPTMAHIHEAPAGVNGPVVVTLFSGSSAPTSTSFTLTNVCVSNVSKDLIKDIIQNPSEYYVNVHTSTFPGGEIRGQLSK